MDRRLFLKLTGLVAAASALDVWPVSAAGPSDAVPAAASRDLVPASRPAAARLRVAEAGLYQITGTVRLEAPLVEISGIGAAKQVSWSGDAGAERPVSSFTMFGQLAGPGLTPEIRVSGGQIDSLTITRLDYV